MCCYDYYITPEEYTLAAENGISRRLLDYRIREMAWNKEKAINQKPQRKRSIKKYIEIAKNNGICEGTFLTRIRKLNWSMEKASTERVMKRSDIVEMLRRINING